MQPDCASVPKTTPTDLLRLGHRLTKVLCKEKSSAFSSPSSHHIITILIIISSSHFSCSNNTPDYNWISSGLFLFWNGGSARFQMKSGVMRCIVQFVFVLDFVFEFIVVSVCLRDSAHNFLLHLLLLICIDPIVVIMRDCCDNLLDLYWS